MFLAAIAAVTLTTEPGTFVQVDNVGMNLVTWNFTKHTTSTVADAQVLSEFVGLHYYPWKDIRLGVVFQVSEQLNPEPKTGDRFRTFAILPQIGFNLWGPLYVAAIFTFAPRSQGAWNLLLGVQGLVGVGFEIAERVKLGFALEVPYNFYPEHTIGLTPLVGVSIKLN